MPPETDVSYTSDLQSALAAAKMVGEGGEAPESGDDDAPAQDAAVETQETEQEPEAPEAEAAAEAPEGEEPADEETPAETTESEGEEPPAATVQAPEHWHPEDHDFLAGLPDDDARQRVIDWRKAYERAGSRKFEEAAEARRLQGEINSIFRPFEQDLALSGMTPSDAIRRLVATEQQIRQDPLGGIARLASHYGSAAAGTAQARELVQHIASALKVDIGASAEQPGQGQEPPDPRDTRLKALEEHIARQEQAARMSEQERHQHAVQSAGTSIQTFAEARDENGRLAHPHFEAVRPVMAALIHAAASTGTEINLDEAYQRAVYADPTLRSDLLKAQQAEASKKASVASRQAVEKAQKARTPRSTSVNVPPPDESDLPQRELLQRVLHQQINGAGA